jgi:SAM-dependent methyltransferase
MIEPKLLAILKSPDDNTKLEYIKNEEKLISKTGIKYDVVNGIPILLPLGEDTMENTKYSREAANIFKNDPYILNSLGLTDNEINDLRNVIKNNKNKIDPVAAFMIGATNGNAYKSLQGNIDNYSIPKFPLINGNNKLLLDIGSNWGRWLVSSSREGYFPVGLDPQIGALLAAKRICNQLGITAFFVCGDARKMPFNDNSFDNVFSYSVIQHLSYDDANKVSKEIKNILKSKGSSYIQMPTKIGLKGFIHRLKNKFRNPVKFEVRYWSLNKLRNYFGSNIGKTTFETDCFFGIGLQFSDIKMVKIIYKPFFIVSEFLRKISRFFYPITCFADSVYVKSVKN